jgi:hypothetical protein
MSAERARHSDRARGWWATSVHGAYIEHRNSGQRAHKQRRLGAHGAGIESQWERAAAKIGHRVARNECTWGGDQACGRRVRSTQVSAIERVWSAYGAGVVGTGGGASGE